jgi:hypothetical protein
MSEKNFYTDVNGQVIPEAHTNRHHLIFPRKDYERSVELQHLRGLGGFILRITIDSHHDLHSNVDSPPQIHRALRNELFKLQHPGQQDFNPYGRFDWTLEYLEAKAKYRGVGSEFQRDAAALLDNLLQQKAYIDLGRVALLE